MCLFQCLSGAHVIRNRNFTVLGNCSTCDTDIVSVIL